MKKVQVLLSSYNGEKYIREQMDSILNQQDVAVKLLVRDDGSTDGTKEILREYEKQYDNVSVEYGENVGVIRSFFSLVDSIELYSNDADAAEAAKYIAFADQDDVWQPEKLKRAVELLEKQVENCAKAEESEKGAQRLDNITNAPLVYCSATQLVDEQLNPLPSALHYPDIRPEFGNALVENMCTGCTCVINSAMLQLLQGKTPEFTVMHDFWIYLVGTCFGKVIYDEKSYILYRQHSGNELGAASSLIENYKRRIKNFKKHRGQLTRQAEELLRLYGSEMPEEKKELAEMLVQAKKNRRIRWKLVKEGKVFRQRKSDDGIMKVLLLLGLL